MLRGTILYLTRGAEADLPSPQSVTADIDGGMRAELPLAVLSEQPLAPYASVQDASLVEEDIDRSASVDMADYGAQQSSFHMA